MTSATDVSNARVNPQTAAEEVFAWGRDDPWKDLRVRVSHKDAFGPADLTTDGRGNILSIPLYRNKPCFGRPETYIRHGKGTAVRRFHGKLNVVQNRCGKCPLNAACKTVARERIKSDPAIESALTAWHAAYSKNPGASRFTGPLYGRLWQAVMQAIVDHGGWGNANDAFLQQEYANATRLSLEKKAKRQREYRESLREKLKIQNVLPQISDLKSLLRTRLEREKNLIMSHRIKGSPKCVSKILLKDISATAKLTADVWLARHLLNEKGDSISPSRIAKFLIEYGRGDGRSYDVLRSRIKTDLARVDVLQSTGVWKIYRPDTDLDDPTLIDECDDIDDMARITLALDDISNEEARKEYLRLNWGS